MDKFKIFLDNSENIDLDVWMKPVTLIDEMNAFKIPDYSSYKISQVELDRFAALCEKCSCDIKDLCAFGCKCGRK